MCNNVVLSCKIYLTSYLTFIVNFINAFELWNSGSMTQINAKIDEEILKEFRDVIYTRMGLRKGDFKKSLEEAMLDYIIRYSKSDGAKDFAKRAKAEHSA